MTLTAPALIGKPTASGCAKREIHIKSVLKHNILARMMLTDVEMLVDTAILEVTEENLAALTRARRRNGRDVPGNGLDGANSPNVTSGGGGDRRVRDIEHSGGDTGRNSGEGEEELNEHRWSEKMEY